jgi:hypothetical protein
MVQFVGHRLTGAVEEGEFPPPVRATRRPSPCRCTYRARRWCCAWTAVSNRFSCSGTRRSCCLGEQPVPLWTSDDQTVRERIKAVVVDANAYGEVGPDLARLGALAKDLAKIDIQTWLPEPVVLAWAEHLTSEWVTTRNLTRRSLARLARESATQRLGTRGRIDILARDAHERYVVVEIKVSGKRSRPDARRGDEHGPAARLVRPGSNSSRRDHHCSSASGLPSPGAFVAFRVGC